MQGDADAVCFAVFAGEERKQYELLADKMKENIRKALRTNSGMPGNV